MKIALVGFEYPPDTAYGGIGTYTFQAARMLGARGHHVEVFTSSPSRSGICMENGLLVHRVEEADRRHFGEKIGPVFAGRHREVQFDVLEGPEYHADAREAVRLVPEIPLVIKLHTPSSLLLRLNYYEPSFRKRIRNYVKALATGSRPTWGYDPESDGYRDYVTEVGEAERALTMEADEIVAPSQSLRDRMIGEWNLDAGRAVVIPYPFVPPDELLAIPAETHQSRVTYLGRLETRKGVLDLARAIPMVLERHPTLKFRFVGASDSSPDPTMDMREYVHRELRTFRRAVEFTGSVPYEQVPRLLSETDICVFPSVWENFPFSCLEAMAGARGIVGSSAGGMTEMLDSGAVGKLVPPRSPKLLADALIELAADSEARIRMGRGARNRVTTQYRAERIGILQEESYARAIRRRRTLGERLRA